VGLENPGPQTFHPRDENGKAVMSSLTMTHARDKQETFTKGNNHPTVKPIELMKYLIKLVTPKGGLVLDPFNGSGSTGCAAVELGCEYVGIDLDPKYVEISKLRIEAWNKEETAFKELFE
jgi:site-specific DNA-methyltransferase (adenine-specific)